MKPLVDLGVITSTKGLKGEVKVKPFGDKQLLISLSTFYLSPPTPSVKTLTLESANRGHDLMILKFKEINSIEEASELKGKFLQQTADQLPEEYFSTSSLINLEVFTSDNILLGSIKQIEESKTHDILVIANETEHRIPLVKDIIQEINVASGNVILKLSKDEL